MQEIRLGASGLWTDPSELEAPKGALREALNVRIKRANCVEPRPGFPETPYGEGVTGHVTHMHEWSGDVLAVVGTALYHGQAEVTDADDASLSITHTETCLVEAADVLLVPTDAGVYVVDRDVSAYPAALTKSRPPVPTLTLGGVLQDDEQCAVRTVIVQEVESGRLVFSGPSDPITVTNESGTAKGVTLRMALGADVTAGMRAHVYRTDIVGIATPPGDEMYLIHDVTLTAGDITAGYVDFALVADTELGASLYTNETQEGILQANDGTPRAKRIAWFKQMAFYGDIRPRYDYRIEAEPTAGGGIAAIESCTATTGSGTLTGLSGGHGLKVGMYVSLSDDVGAADAAFAANTRITASGATTVTISPVAVGNYTGNVNFHDVINVDGSEYVIASTTVLGSRQFGDIEGLVALVNADGGDVVASVATDAAVPRFVLESSSTFNVSAIAVSALSIIGLWNATPEAAVLNTERWPARLMWSKSLQPESVPALNFLDIGKAWEPILGLGVTRDALFVLKTDGVWRVSGDSPETLRVDEYDRSIRAFHPLAITTMDDQVWAWTTSGIVAISDGGTQRASDQAIANLLDETQLNAYTLSRAATPTYVGGCFMGACQQENILLVGAPSATADSDTAGAEYVYALEAKTGAWVRWDSASDWYCAADYQGAIVLGGDAAIGYQSADLSDDGEAGVQCRVEWVAAVAGDPSSLAHWRAAKLLLADATECDGFTVEFASERVPTKGSVTVSAENASEPVVLRCAPTRAHARCQRLRVSMESSLLNQAWRIEALALTFEQMRGGERLP